MGFTLDILELLVRRDACVSHIDPYVPTLRHGTLSLASRCGGVVIATDHNAIDCAATVRDAELTVHVRNALKERGGVLIRRL